MAGAIGFVILVAVRVEDSDLFFLNVPYVPLENPPPEVLVTFRVPLVSPVQEQALNTAETPDACFIRSGRRNVSGNLIRLPDTFLRPERIKQASGVSAVFNACSWTGETKGTRKVTRTSGGGFSRGT